MAQTSLDQAQERLDRLSKIYETVTENIPSALGDVASFSEFDKTIDTYRLLLSTATATYQSTYGHTPRLDSIEEKANEWGRQAGRYFLGVEASGQLDRLPVHSYEGKSAFGLDSAIERLRGRVTAIPSTARSEVERRGLSETFTAAATRQAARRGYASGIDEASTATQAYVDQTASALKITPGQRMLSFVPGIGRFGVMADLKSLVQEAGIELRHQATEPDFRLGTEIKELERIGHLEASVASNTQDRASLADSWDRYRSTADGRSTLRNLGIDPTSDVDSIDMQVAALHGTATQEVDQLEQIQAYLQR